MFESIRKLRTHDLRSALESASQTPRTPRSDSHSLDSRLLEDEEPQLGAHVISHRRRYSHHGIYVGGGRVVHYAGFAYGLSSGPIEEVSLCEFAHRRPIWTRRAVRPAFPPEEVVRRARMRVGESQYQVLRNNCEHFCEWCLHGEPRSFQVECLSLFGRALVVIVLALAALMQPMSRLEIRNALLVKGACARAAEANSDG
jgi:hypothetical protein